MYTSQSHYEALEKVDIQKGGGELQIWVRGGSVSLMLGVEEARWLMEAVKLCLDEMPTIPADASEKGALFAVRSPAHHRGPGIERPQAEVVAAPSVCRHDFTDRGVCPKCGAHEDNEIAGPNGKHSAFNDPPDPY